MGFQYLEGKKVEVTKKELDEIKEKLGIPNYK